MVAGTCLDQTCNAKRMRYLCRLLQDMGVPAAEVFRGKHVLPLLCGELLQWDVGAIEHNQLGEDRLTMCLYHALLTQAAPSRTTQRTACFWRPPARSTR